MARLAARFVVPIMADEAVNGPEDALAIARLGAADDAGAEDRQVGRHPRNAAHRRRRRRRRHVAVRRHHAGRLGRLDRIGPRFCLPAAAVVGTELFGPLLLKDDIVANPPRYADFEMEIPTGPGLGLELDEDKLAFYRRDR